MSMDFTSIQRRALWTRAIPKACFFVQASSLWSSAMFSTFSPYTKRNFSRSRVSWINFLSSGSFTSAFPAANRQRCSKTLDMEPARHQNSVTKAIAMAATESFEKNGLCKRTEMGSIFPHIIFNQQQSTGSDSISNQQQQSTGSDSIGSCCQRTEQVLR